MNKTIRGGARQIIYKVYMRCMQEFQGGKVLSPMHNVYKRTADMTGVSESTVRRIAMEGIKNMGKFGTPAKHRKGRPTKNWVISTNVQLGKKKHYFYSVKKELPTLSRLLSVLRDDIGYNGSRKH